MMDKVQEACNLKHFRSHKFADFRLSLLCKHVRSVPFSLLFLALYCHEQNVQMYNQYWKRLITYSLYISSSTTEILQKDSLFNTFKTNFVMQLTSLKLNYDKNINSQITLHTTSRRALPYITAKLTESHRIHVSFPPDCHQHLSFWQVFSDDCHLLRCDMM